MMKKTAVSTILKGLLDRVHRALFRHMVKSGLVLCAVEPGEDGHEAQTEGQGVQSGEESGAAAANDQGKGAAQSTGEGVDDGADDEVVITLEGVSPAPHEEQTEEQRDAPQWVKDLRKADREKSRQIRELQQQLAEKAAPAAPGAIVVGEKPTLEGCDFDSERFETELTAWHERKLKADEQAAQKRKEQESAQTAWNTKLTAYKTAGAALKVPDFEDAEAVVLDTFDQTQQAIIVSGAENPAALVYALGKNPAEAKKLASIKDPIQYAFAAAKLESKLKVTPRKAAPAPERVVRGSAAGATGVDSTLERLEAEADRTGDRTKVVAYKRQLKQGKS